MSFIKNALNVKMRGKVSAGPSQTIVSTPSILRLHNPACYQSVTAAMQNMAMEPVRGLSTRYFEVH